MKAFFEFFLNYWPKLFTALQQHLIIVGITLLFSLLLAAVFTLILLRFPKASEIAVGVLGVVYSIPSLALFALMIPLTGLGRSTAIIVLVLYNQFLLLRNFLAGLNNVDSAVMDAAMGMGMSFWQRLWRVQLPLAAPVIMAGIHLAVISTIGIANIAATINAGGLGTILFDGLRTRNTFKILWGSIFSGGLALLANGILNGIERWIRRKNHLNVSKTHSFR